MIQATQSKHDGYDENGEAMEEISLPPLLPGMEHAIEEPVLYRLANLPNLAVAVVVYARENNCLN